MLKSKLFQGNEYPLYIYNGEALISKAFRFWYEDCDNVETVFDFPDYVSSYFKVYNERLGRVIRTIALTRSGTYLVANTSEVDMTFDSNGNYYYEVGYIMAGGYEQVLRYGKLQIQ